MLSVVSICLSVQERGDKLKTVLQIDGKFGLGEILCLADL